MDVNNIIASALRPLGYPVFENVYNRDIDNSDILNIRNVENGYFVFVYISENGVLYGDNRCICEQTSVYVHFYTKNALPVEQIKSALTVGGFNLRNSKRTHEQATGYNHFITEATILCDT